MQIAQVIGGYSLGSADLLRRAMGKKKVEEMAQQRDIFVTGAVANGLSEDKAAELFGLMEKFAGYGFNKSHAAAYASKFARAFSMSSNLPAWWISASFSAANGKPAGVSRALVSNSMARGVSVRCNAVAASVSANASPGLSSARLT